MFVAVAPVNAASHENHPLQLVKCRRVTVDRGLHIGQWTDRDQGHPARVSPNLIEQKSHPVPVFVRRLLLGISCLAEDIGVGRRDPRHDRNVLTSQRSQVPIQQTRPQFRVAVRSGNAEDLQFRALEGEGERECIIDIVANVRIHYRKLWSRSRCSGGGACRPGARLGDSEAYHAARHQNDK